LHVPEGVWRGRDYRLQIDQPRDLRDFGGAELDRDVGCCVLGERRLKLSSANKGAILNE
jgi:hypothetical protein